MPTEGKREASVAVDDGFVTRRITVLTAANLALTVEARCVGALAVHEWNGAVESSRFAVTSTTTGLMVLGLPSRRDAERMAAALWQRCKVAFSQPDQKAILANLSPWMFQWINTAEREGRYLDPEPFREMQKQRGRP